MSRTLSLSEAKSRLSEVVRAARTQGETTIITVDGEPAVRIVPIEAPPRRMTDVEVATHRALMDGLRRLPRPPGEFDAVELIREGRR